MITPQFTGQYYRDTTTGNIWVANSTTPGDWSLVVQDMQVAWTPTNLKLGQMMGFAGDTNANGIPPIPGITSLTFADATRVEIIELNAPPNLISVSFPNLLTATGDNGYIAIYDAPLLQSFSAPLLVSMEQLLDLDGCSSLVTLDLSSLASVTGGAMDFHGCTSLPSLNLPSLVTGRINASGCTSLTTVTVPVLVPTSGGTYNFAGCALSAASVNQILARCVANAGFVSGLVDTSGGTSDAPTGQGITDKNTLNARLPGLAVTN